MQKKSNVERKRNQSNVEEEKGIRVMQKSNVEKSNVKSRKWVRFLRTFIFDVAMLRVLLKLSKGKEKNRNFKINIKIVSPF